jgi:hypothetical protein
MVLSFSSFGFVVDFIRDCTLVDRRRYSGTFLFCDKSALIFISASSVQVLLFSLMARDVFLHLHVDVEIECIQSLI